VFLFWQIVLIRLAWPSLSLVGQYFLASVGSLETYKAVLMTGCRAAIAMGIGFSLAMLLAILTGRTLLGWILLFFALLALQKIPAIAMVHVYVNSRLGFGLLTTISLASTVVLSFTWLVLHHRAATLDRRETFALRVTGLKGVRLALYGLIPHLGASVGSAARLAMSISLVMVILGEWQGVWADGSIWEFGLGVQISRAYESVDSAARVLAWCGWLGILGVLLDAIVQCCLALGRILLGVDFTR
jgi:ABC-type nitrate/sulfonate/bicarbonate transport system permease component